MIRDTDKPRNAIDLPILDSLTLPIIHLNGSSKESLIDGLKEAWTALEEAEKVLRRHYPHDRDYYISPDPEAGSKARAEHDSRLLRIKSVRNEIEHICHEIYTD